MNDVEILGLFSSVASHLTDKEVVTRFKTPAVPGARSGVEFIDGKRAVINILPGQTLDDAYTVFLNEVAHCRLHWRTPVKTTSNSFKTVSSLKVMVPVKSSASPRVVFTDAEKRQAAEQVMKWDAWATRQAGDKVLDKLRALSRIKVDTYIVKVGRKK